MHGETLKKHLQTFEFLEISSFLKLQQSLGGSSPLCAITNITNNIRYKSQKTTKFIIEYRVKWMTTCFELVTLVRP